MHTAVSEVYKESSKKPNNIQLALLIREVKGKLLEFELTVATQVSNSNIHSLQTW